MLPTRLTHLQCHDVSHVTVTPDFYSNCMKINVCLIVRTILFIIWRIGPFVFYHSYFLQSLDEDDGS